MLLNLPVMVECPRCGQDTPSYLNDYDIECGDPNPHPGVLELDIRCQECDHEWTWVIRNELRTMRATECR